MKLKPAGGNQMSCQAAEVALYNFHSSKYPAMLPSAAEALGHCEECRACWIHYVETFCLISRSMVKRAKQRLEAEEKGLTEVEVLSEYENNFVIRHLDLCPYCELEFAAVAS